MFRTLASKFCILPRLRCGARFSSLSLKRDLKKNSEIDLVQIYEIKDQFPCSLLYLFMGVQLVTAWSFSYFVLTELSDSTTLPDIGKVYNKAPLSKRLLISVPVALLSATVGVVPHFFLRKY